MFRQEASQYKPACGVSRCKAQADLCVIKMIQDESRISLLVEIENLDRFGKEQIKSLWRFGGN